MGIAQYQPAQFRYIWDYKFGLVDTFGLTKSRSWYSYEQNAPMNAGTTSPYGNRLDSMAEADHIIGQKQYELVNHLANVQETVSDKKFSKDLNGDSTRDEYRAASVMVYDYYPFGMLMPGRSLDTAGICVTRTIYQEIPHYNWISGGALYGTADTVGTDTISAGSGTGVDVSGLGGGIKFRISGITAWAIQLQTFFSFISGTATITVWQGTNTGSGGVQLGSTTTGVTSPAASVSVSAGGTAATPATVTVVVNMPTGSARSLFNLDSIGYQTLTYTLATGTYTQCGDPVDKYEFGFNGQMKSNEIAGVGNNQDYGYRMYDVRLGRFKSVDPFWRDYPWNSAYAFAENDVIRAVDLEGGEKLIVTGKYDESENLMNYQMTFNTGDDKCNNCKFGFINKDGSISYSNQARSHSEEWAAGRIDKYKYKYVDYLPYESGESNFHPSTKKKVNESKSALNKVKGKLSIEGISFGKFGKTDRNGTISL